MNRQQRQANRPPQPETPNRDPTAPAYEADRLRSGRKSVPLPSNPKRSDDRSFRPTWCLTLPT